MVNQDCTGSFPRFAGDWIEAWNNRDLDGVLAHYAEHVRFTSPVAAKILGRATIEGREALRAYFSKGLEQAPGRRFELLAEAKGVGGTTLVYRSGGRLVCETVRFDDRGRIVEAHAHYAEPGTAEKLAEALRRIPAWLAAAVDMVLGWVERECQRRQLAALDHRLLKDIGLSRTEALHEADKPFWRE